MSRPRRFVSVSRVIDPRTGVHSIDAIDEDGRAWWLIAGDDSSADQWQELRPLPTREERP